MSMDVFTDTPLVSISGAVSIAKDLQYGTAGNLTVAGLTTASGGLSVAGSLTGVSLTAVSQLTASTGISVTAGGVTVTAGGISVTAGASTFQAETVAGVLTASTGISVTAGGVTVTAGGISVTAGTTTLQSVTAAGSITASTGISITAGGITVVGGASIDQLTGGMSPTAVSIGANGTIATNVRMSRFTVTAAQAGIILTAGTVNGQTVVVDNRTTTGSFTATMAASGTSNVLGGTNVVISGMTNRLFVWDGSFWN